MSSTPTYGVGDASYQAAGGIDGLRRLVDDFYRVMDESPAAAELRRLHPESLEASRDKQPWFLSGWLGGPRHYAQKFGPISIPQFHTRWEIGDVERDAWLDCMAYAIARQPYSTEFAEYLLQQLRVPAQRILQAQPAHGCPGSRA